MAPGFSTDYREVACVPMGGILLYGSRPVRALPHFQFSVDRLLDEGGRRKTMNYVWEPPDMMSASEGSHGKADLVREVA